MHILIVGSSSGLGKEIFEQKIKTGDHLYTISRYKSSSTFSEQSKFAKKTIKTNLETIQSQEEITLLVKDMPVFDQIYLTVGGGFGKKDILPSFEDMLFVYKMNVFIISSFIKGLYENQNMDKNTKICIISSVASLEVTASPTYSSAKSALNSLSKTISKQNKNYFGSLSNFICGAFEGNGTGFDRLKNNNEEAYNSFIKNRLPNGKPIKTYDLASFIISTMSFPKDILDGLTIKVDGNESFSI